MCFKQQNIFHLGWLHTGDLGYYDEEGNIFIVDRMKEVIKYRGHHISPVEIESILVKHPKVLEAAVVPVPHSSDDEHPIAFITTLNNFKVFNPFRTECPFLPLNKKLSVYILISQKK